MLESLAAFVIQRALTYSAVYGCSTTDVRGTLCCPRSALCLGFDVWMNAAEWCCSRLCFVDVVSIIRRRRAVEPHNDILLVVIRRRCPGLHAARAGPDEAVSRSAARPSVVRNAALHSKIQPSCCVIGCSGCRCIRSATRRTWRALRMDTGFLTY